MIQMNKNEILKSIKKEVYYAELPSKMDVSIDNHILHITMDAEGVLQNMQNDASSFEGWIFCLKAFFPNINTVVIDWEDHLTSCIDVILCDLCSEINKCLCVLF